MDVTVENTGKLERLMNIVIPAEVLTEKVEKRLKELTKTVKMDGFRPGKVPVSLIKKRFGDSVYHEIAAQAMNDSYFEAIEKEDIQPASYPKFSPKVLEAGKPLEYSATFEVFPEIELAAFDKLQIEKPIVELKEENIQKTIEDIRKQYASWKSVNRAAQDTDQLKIDFVGKMNGEEFAGGSGKDVALVLGSKTMIEGFEAGLIGKKAGETCTLNLNFPAEYHQAELAGKEVIFEVTVNAVEESELPEVNEEFIKKLGVKAGSPEAFKEEIQHRLQKELDFAIKNVMKEQITEKLAELNPIEMPKGLIAQELEAMVAPMKEMFKKQKAKFELPEEMKKEYEQKAEVRVRLSLLFSEIMKKYKLELDEKKVAEYIDELAKDYDTPDEAKQWFYSNKETLSKVQSHVLEEQILDKILEEATIIEKQNTFDEIMNKRKQ